MRSKCVSAFLLFAAFLGSTGCHKRTPVTVVSPPPPPPPPPPVVVSPVDQADRAFAVGNYDEAARGYENYLRTTTSDGHRDQALFHLALIYALRPAPATDWPRAVAMLKQLIEEYPDSPLKAQASLIVSLRTELDQVSTDAKLREQRLRQLTTELDRLKKIDADRRKRP